MAKPRVFVSSTYYDLKHIRASLDVFVEDLGFESILSEKGDIAYQPDIPLDESCYREAETADIFVLIIGGRYGTGASTEEKKEDRAFYERYESITKKEYEAALKKDAPTYILIEGAVYAEYQTYLKNRDNEKVVYAHVQSVNVFRFIEEILSKPRNNPTQTFERFSDIESWLRDQWAGLFRDMLNKRSQQQQISALSLQVAELKEVSSTMKKYLEAVMSGISQDDSTKLIEAEKKRLAEVELRKKIAANRWCDFVVRKKGVDITDVIKALKRAETFEDFVTEIGNVCKDAGDEEQIRHTLNQFKEAKVDFNEARELLGLQPIKNQPERAATKRAPKRVGHGAK